MLHRFFFFFGVCTFHERWSKMSPFIERWFFFYYYWCLYTVYADINVCWSDFPFELTIRNDPIEIIVLHTTCSQWDGTENTYIFFFYTSIPWIWSEFFHLFSSFFFKASFVPIESWCASRAYIFNKQFQYVIYVNWKILQSWFAVLNENMDTAVPLNYCQILI